MCVERPSFFLVASLPVSSLFAKPEAPPTGFEVLATMVAPRTISPNGDGIDDKAELRTVVSLCPTAGLVGEDGKYVRGKSILTGDAARLARRAGTGVSTNKIPIGQAGCRE